MLIGEGRASDDSQSSRGSHSPVAGGLRVGSLYSLEDVIRKTLGDAAWHVCTELDAVLPLPLQGHARAVV